MPNDSQPKEESTTPANHETTDTFPYVCVEGPPEKAGLEYGRQAGDRVHKSVEIYQNAFAQKGVSWEKAREIAHGFIPRIEHYSPAFLGELKAIAEGAELPLEDVVAINARTELLYAQRHRIAGQAEDDGDGCTGAIAMPEATADGHTLHGQNWDWRDECADSAIVLHMLPAKGPSMLHFVEAGILARAGMNSAGIAVTGNFLQTDQEYGNQGVPLPFIRRKILMSESLAEAVKVVYQAPRTFSNNLMLSQCDGEAVNLEATPAEVFWSQPENGLLVHANHFTHHAALVRVRDVEVEKNTDSLYRDRRVRAHLSKRHPEIRVQDFKDAFADRYGAPRAICRSPVRGPGGKTSATVATIVMDTTARKMWIAKRPYGEKHFVEYSLD